MPGIKSFIFFCFLLFVIQTVQAGVRGEVKDSAGQPVPYARLLTYTLPDSNIVTDVITDSGGYFEIDVPGTGSFLLQAMASGYQAAYVKVNAGDVRPVHMVLLADTRMLGVVTVTAIKPLIQRKPDRTIFNVESSIAALGADAYEMLKKAPGVRVSQGNVGIVGKSSVSVMINDKLVRLSGDELEAYLRSISADNLSRIEVITTPPAKYDAQGNAGIINIVTKKSQNDGWNGSLSVAYQQRFYGSEKFGGNFNYRKGKLNLYANTNINSFTFVSFQNNTMPYPDQQQEQRLVQQNMPLYTRTELGVDYKLSEKSLIGLQYTLGTGDVTMKQGYRTDVVHAADRVLDSIIVTDAVHKEKALRNVANVNYEYKIDSSGRRFTIDLNYFNRKANPNRDFYTGHLLANGVGTGFLGFYKTSGEQVVDIKTASADLELPGSIIDLAFGGRLSYIFNSSNNLFNVLSGNGYVQDPAKSNWFEYSEHTQALYANAGKTWDKWEMKAGLRGEYTQTKGVSLTLAQTNTNEYFKLFPTAYMQYTPSANHTFNISYGRRIERPNMYDLDPFREYTTSLSYETGNPFLQPSFTDNLELAYTFLDNYTFSVFGEHVTREITSVSLIDTVSRSFYFSQANAGNSINTGVSASGTFSPLRFWECNVQAYGYYNKFVSSFYGAESSRALPSFSVMASNNFTLNSVHTLLAECTFMYTAKQQSDFDVKRAIAGVSAGMKALFFNKRLVFALNVFDITHSDYQIFENQYNGAISDHYYDARAVFLNLTWKFGNKNVKDRRRRDADNEEIQRAGG